MELPQNAVATLIDFVEFVSRCSGIEFRPEPVHAKPGTGQTAILINLVGRDTPLLLANQGELLNAMESLAADILGLDDTLRPCICFDSGRFRASRENTLRGMAQAAVDEVRSTAVPHVFPPLNSRDRRLLRLALAGYGLNAESIGAEPLRHVVLYPEGALPAIEARSTASHSSF
jgi:spoIIIJ-associated protein